MQFHPCEAWLAPSFAHTVPLAGASPRRALCGMGALFGTRVHLTLKRTHIPGKFMSLEGTRSLVQCPGTSHPSPSPQVVWLAQWTLREGEGQCLNDSALNLDISLKGKATTCDHTSLLLPISAWCDLVPGFTHTWGHLVLSKAKCPISY